MFHASGTGGVVDKKLFVPLRKVMGMVSHLQHPVKNADLTDLDLHVVRYKPAELDVLAKKTQFSRKELQIMYRGFKQECPSGIVSEETFKDIYAQFFPQGDSGMYAHYVFATFDQDRTGSLTFEQFVQNLSILSRGSTEEKLMWAFQLYDLNNDGIITKPEMLEIVTAIYELLGRHTEPAVLDSTPAEHVDKVFQKLDTNRDGVITVEEFMAACQTDSTVIDALASLDTVL